MSDAKRPNNSLSSIQVQTANCRFNNKSDSYPLTQAEANLLRAIVTNPSILDKQILMITFAKLLDIFLEDYLEFKKQNQSESTKLSLTQFESINNLAVKYLKKSLNEIPHAHSEHAKPKRPPTPPGPLFKKPTEQHKIQTRKRIVIHTKRLPPPPPVVTRQSKAIIVEGCLPKSEIKRQIQAKQDPSHPDNNLLLEYNIPNIKFKFSIEI